MKKLIYLMVVIAILGLIVSGCSIPLKSVVPTSEKGNPKPELGAPVIERGVFVDHGYSSPPWYPPEDETDSYRLGPKLYWNSINLPIDVKVYSKDALTGVFVAVLAALEEWDGYTLTDLYDKVIEDSTTPPPGAVHYWYYANNKEMVEFDIVFDIEETWSTTVGATGAFDVQNIATHEAGHTLVLGDLRSPKDGALTMHAYTWLGDTVKRTLGSGDILGVRAIYGE